MRELSGASLQGYLPKGSPSNIIRLGIRFPHVDLGGHKHFRLLRHDYWPLGYCFPGEVSLQVFCPLFCCVVRPFLTDLRSFFFLSEF